MDVIKKNKYVIIIAILIILVILLIFLTQYLLFVNNFLCGLWVCDDDFCNNSEINQLLFYIGDYKLFCDRKLCVLILDSNDVPYQFTFDMTCNPITKTIELTCEEESIFPNSMDMELSITDGSLILSDGEHEYARLYKDNINNI